MIYDKTAATHLIGSLIQNPSLLVESDKYFLSPVDFAERMHATIFSSINNLYFGGVVKIDAMVIEDYLRKYPEIHETYTRNHGTDFVMGAIEIAELSNFDFYYDRIKKLTLLRDLKQSGFSIDEWYIEDVYDIGRRQQMELKLEQATIKEILQSVQNKLYSIESDFVNKKNFDFQNVYEGLRDLMGKLKNEPAIGLPFSTDIFSTITFGARPMKYYLISGDTGTGKSRTALENMFYLSIPVRWNLEKGEWENNGSFQRSLFISTELDFTELQLPALAYISGINEGKIKTYDLSESEKERVGYAINILEEFQNNVFFYHMPDPTIQQLTTSVKQKIVQHDIQNVFFDYIHTSPQLLSEFKFSGLREDVVLNMLSTALKNLANEMEVFVWSGTQVNRETREAEFASTVNLRGSTAIADKTDFVGILRPATPDLLRSVEPLIRQYGIKPNMFMDVSKNRGSEYKRVRLWRYVDLGNLRSKDLFLTDEYGELVPLDFFVAKCPPLSKPIESILEQKPQVVAPKEFTITV